MTMKFIDNLRATGLFLRIVNDPNRTDLIFRSIDLLSKQRDEPSLVEIERFALANDQFRAMYEARYLPAPIDMAALAQLPEGTFGHAFHRHLVRNSLDPNLFPRFESRYPIEYLSVRIYQDHDLWHALLGLGVGIEDELALQAFGIAQYRSPIGTMLIAGGLLHILRRNPADAVRAFEGVIAGYLKGRAAKFLLSERLHDMFPRPLAAVRAELGIAA